MSILDTSWIERVSLSIATMLRAPVPTRDEGVRRADPAGDDAATDGPAGGHGGRGSCVDPESGGQTLPPTR